MQSDDVGDNIGIWNRASLSPLSPTSVTNIYVSNKIITFIFQCTYHAMSSCCSLCRIQNPSVNTKIFVLKIFKNFISWKILVYNAAKTKVTLSILNQDASFTRYFGNTDLLLSNNNGVFCFGFCKLPVLFWQKLPFSTKIFLKT